MLTIKMGPQLLATDGVSTAPQNHRVRHVSGSSTGSLNGVEMMQFPLISQFSDMPAAAIGAMGQHRQVKLDRSISEPNTQNKLQPIASQQGKNVLNPSRYKTEICRPFIENGFCKYGDKCQFAHGSQDVRGLPRHPKYKTELCRTFHTVGFCPYGPRCHFIHSEDEGKLVEINAMKQQQAAQQAAREMAQLQAQQQALDVQLKALVSQVQFTNQLVHPAAGTMTSPSFLNERRRFQHSISVHPQLRVEHHQLGSTGDSPAESTCSGGSPPVLSPVFTEDSVSDSNSDSFCSMLTPPVSADSSFSFSGGEMSPLTMSPTRFQQHQQQQIQPKQQQVRLDNANLSESSNHLAASLASRIQALSLGQNTINTSEMAITANSQAVSTSPVFSPSHSPDDQLKQQMRHPGDDQSTSDSGLHPRLPIFAKLAQNS